VGRLAGASSDPARFAERVPSRHCVPHRRATGADFATGVSFFPFFLLVLAPLSSQLLAGLLDGNKVILSVAGLIALTGAIRDD
jgi:hypothetical protein